MLCFVVLMIGCLYLLAELVIASLGIVFGILLQSAKAFFSLFRTSEYVDFGNN